MPSNMRLLLVFCLLFASQAFADKYQDTKASFVKAIGSSQQVANAYAYAIFPNIGKGGMGIGAAYGKGKIFVAGRSTGSVSMKQLSIGFQLGGQAYSQLILFKNRKAYKTFISNNFQFGAQVTAVALTLSANLEASTKGNSVGLNNGEDSQTSSSYHNGMAVYTIAKGGLMYEASIGGQKFKFKAKPTVR